VALSGAESPTPPEGSELYSSKNLHVVSKRFQEAAQERSLDLANASSRSRLRLEAMATSESHFWVNLWPHDRT
jgi:hypothetical protein